MNSERLVAAVMVLLAAGIFYAAVRRALRAKDRYQSFRYRDDDPWRERT